MDFHTPFGAPYMNGPAPWHPGGHFSYSFNDDSGYVSSDSDSSPFPSFDTDDNIHEGIDQFDYLSPWPRYQQHTAFVNAQYLHPVAAFRLHHPYLASSIETYDLPPPLPFEQQRRNYGYASNPNPIPSYHRGNRDREPSHTAASLQDFRANTHASLNFTEHGARLPTTLPPLHDRVVESETEISSSPLPRLSTPIRHDASFPDDNPELKTKPPPQPKPSSPTISLSPRKTGGNPPPSASAVRRDGPRRPHSSASLSDRDQRRLVDEWRHLYRERKAFEEEKRALGRHIHERCPSRHDGGGCGGIVPEGAVNAGWEGGVGGIFFVKV